MWITFNVDKITSIKIKIRSESLGNENQRPMCFATVKIGYHQSRNLRNQPEQKASATNIAKQRQLSVFADLQFSL